MLVGQQQHMMWHRWTIFFNYVESEVYPHNSIICEQTNENFPVIVKIETQLFKMQLKFSTQEWTFVEFLKVVIDRLYY